MIKVVKLNKDAIIPSRAYPTDAGLDIYAIEDTFIPVGSTTKIATGISIRVPIDTVGKLEDRSSMGAKGLKVLAGVVDYGYTGEISVVMSNLTCEEDTDSILFRKGKLIKKGDKVAQMLVYHVRTDKVTVLEHDNEKYSRSQNGFGSSGR